MIFGKKIHSLPSVNENISLSGGNKENPHQSEISDADFFNENSQNE